MATITQTQVTSSYNFTIEYADGFAQLLKIAVEDSASSVVYENSSLETDITYTIPLEYPDNYSVFYYLWDGTNWVLDAQEGISILDYKIEMLWNNAISNPIDPNQNYTYSPSFFRLNNNVCPVPPNFSPEITFNLYDLVDEEWVLVDSDTRDLTGWDDENPDNNLISYDYTTRGYPSKIIVTVSNCYEIRTHNTYLDDEILITSVDAVNTHSETQFAGSYTINFNYSFGNQNGEHPMLIITPENNSYTKCNLYIYKNNEVIHTYEGLTPTQFYPYTFAESTLTGVSGVEYIVRYLSINNNTGEQYYQDFPFTVKEYKPTFNLPTIQCKKINEPSTISISSLRFNCFAEDSSLHYTPYEYQASINYKLYYLNSNTYTWEPANGDTIEEYTGVTVFVQNAVDDYIDANPEATDSQIGIYLQQEFAYGKSAVELWTPEKLTMVKFVTTVTNYSTSVMKETIFPICGTWKIRRMSCGNYRIYNYTENTVNFTINKSQNQSFVQIPNGAGQVGALSFENLNLIDDGVYQITDGNTTKYIFNFCALENCILELQKKVLLDDTLCDACKLDKVLYQKALRLIPIYETWKKLLDRDWVYEIQYQSTDVAGSLAAIYDAEELYIELKDLCDNCNYKSEKCNCK